MTFAISWLGFHKSFFQAPFKHDTGPGRLYFHDQCFTCDGCKTALRGNFVNGEKGFFCQRCAEREGATQCAEMFRKLHEQDARQVEEIKGHLKMAFEHFKM